MNTLLLILGWWAIGSLSTLLAMLIINRLCGMLPSEIDAESWSVLWFGVIIFPVGIFAIVGSPFVVLWKKYPIKDELFKERHLWWIL